MNYTKKQLEYIESVDSNAHMSDVRIIGELDPAAVLREVREKVTTIYPEWALSSQYSLRKVTEIIDAKIKEMEG